MSEKPTIVCFGDSLTVGRPGVSYLDKLGAYTCENYGLGGDTLTGVSRRIKAYVRRLSSKTMIVIAIGANDLMLPYLGSQSKAWARQIRHRKAIFLTEPVAFLHAYEALLTFLTDHDVVVVSVPCLSEDLTHPLNQSVEEVNSGLIKLCKKKGVHVADYFFWQQRQIKKKTSHTSYFVGKRPFRCLADVLWTLIPTKADRLSQKRGLAVTIDGIHLNHLGAQGLADCVADALQKIYHGRRA